MIAPEALVAVRADLEAARERAGQKLDQGLKGVEAARLHAVAAAAKVSPTAAPRMNSLRFTIACRRSMLAPAPEEAR